MLWGVVRIFLLGGKVGAVQVVALMTRCGIVALQASYNENLIYS